MAQPEAARPWWLTEPLSIIELSDAFHVAARGADGFDPAASVARMVELNATAAHVFPLGCHLDGDTLLFAHRSPGDPPAVFDYLGDWLAHARPAGLRTVVYFNVHSVKARYAQMHPDWQQRRADGSAKDDVYGIESAFCVNSPWRDWVFDRLRELCAYPIDGIFFDGPVIFSDCCYCQACREGFRRRFDADPPPKTDRAHADFPRLVDFQADSMAAFLADSRRVIKDANPDLLFYMNSNPISPGWATGRDNRRLARHQDILASEGGFFYGDLLANEPLWKVGLNARMLAAEASQASVPTLVFDCIGHKSWTYFMLPAAEVRLMWAASVAHGAGTWMATMADSMNEPGVDAVGDLYALARRHRADLFDTRSLAEIAVMASKATMNYYAGADVPLTDFTAAARGSRAGNFLDELNGWVRALWSTQTPFDVIDDQSVEGEDLSRYRMIVLPNAACLSARACEALDAFVRAGGALVGSFETAVYDEFGRRREQPGLAETFGAAPTAPQADGPRQWDYLFRHDGGAWTGGIAATYIPSPAYALAVRTLGSAEATLTFSEPLADRYAGLAVDSGRPAMVVSRRGEGTAVYFACDIGCAIKTWRLNEHVQLVRNLVDRLAPSPVRVDGASPALEAVLRQSRDGRDVLVHLINATGGMTRPIRRVVALRDLQVHVRLPAPAASACTLRRPGPIDLRADGDWTTFRLPALEEFEIVKIRLSR